MADLLGWDFRLAEPHNLYACHDFLLKHKADLFSHLVTRWRDLVNVEFDALLYNLTSTYFEINAAPRVSPAWAGANETVGGRARGRQAPPRLQPRQTAGLSTSGDRTGGHAGRSAAGPTRCRRAIPGIARRCGCSSAVLPPSIRASVCAAHLSFMRKFANGVFAGALNVRRQALQR
jgi:hypothetical protein